MSRQGNMTDATTVTSSPAVLALKTAATIAVNCCKILFFLAVGAAFMIYN